MHFASHHMMIIPALKTNRGNRHLNTHDESRNLVIFAGFGFRQAFQPFIQPVQSFNHDVFQPFMQGVMHMIMGDHDHGHKFTDDGTESPQATGHDEMFPRDCGRNEETGTGKLCFPDGLLCQDSE